MGENMTPPTGTVSTFRRWELGVATTFRSLTTLYEMLRALSKLLRTIERLHDNIRHLRSTLTTIQQEEAIYEMSQGLRQSREALEPGEPPRE
ncbi:hypothetical protein KIN20_000105 [Parelaphostrongylus tenuis]|uniref:Uncharacterized protein n=1 Tax=Parelaphostrongylus tenuis TaxID=148309 RepID=A0AAD5MAP7_PARTN|nr:hypothetical protein KIN20_000105 [Parelaphostrongylus tenuis]